MVASKTIEIDMGHRVPNHKSKCSNPHGHRYSIEVFVDDKIITTPGASDEGMVIDFSDLKEVMMNEIDKIYDHSFVVYSGDEFVEVFRKFIGFKMIFVDFIPTAENLAKHWFDLVESELIKRKIKTKAVRVYETPTSCAYYEKHT